MTHSVDHIVTMISGMFHRLGSLVCFNSELTPETMNPFRKFGRTPWIGQQPIQ